MIFFERFREMSGISPLDRSIENLSREIQVVIHCSRLKFRYHEKNKVEKLLREKIDWGFVIETAEQHRVLPIVYKNLTENFTTVIPQTTFNALRFWFHNNTIHNKLLLRELTKLADIFKKLTIPAIFFKGPITALTIYGDIALRQFNDLDVLVKEEDYSRVQNQLVNSGYRKKTDWGYECGYRNDDSGINVDLHQNLDEYNLSRNFNRTEQYNRLEQTQINNSKILSFSIEDTLISLCINYSKDLFINKTKLSQISDIMNLVDNHKCLDWDAVINRASDLGVKRILFLCLILSKQIYGLKLSPKVEKQIKVDRKFKSLVTESLNKLINLLSGKSYFLEYEGGYVAEKMLFYQMKERLVDRFPVYYQVPKYYIQ